MAKTRKFSLALAETLEHFVGKILVIGPQSEEHSTLQFIDVPTSDKLAPLAIIPVQFGALYLAKSKGLPIGTLRYIAQITRDE
jgi:fructoselysine-6-P-deglycase FrlB-like protein